jgi:hypothetical protein
MSESPLLATSAQVTQPAHTRGSSGDTSRRWAGVATWSLAQLGTTPNPCSKEISRALEARESWLFFSRMRELYG